MKKKDTGKIKKCINEYEKKISKHINTHDQLQNKLEDIKVTLNLNKDLIFKYIYESLSAESNSEFKDNNSIFNELKENNSKASKRVDELFLQKVQLEKDIYRIQEELNSKTEGERDIARKTSENISILNNRINEKDTIIINLKREIEKVIIDKNIEFCKDVFVINPTKASLESNNELIATRELIDKLTKMLNEEKIKNEGIEKLLGQYETELERLKSFSPNKNKNDDFTSLSKDNYSLGQHYKNPISSNLCQSEIYNNKNVSDVEELSSGMSSDENEQNELEIFNQNAIAENMVDLELDSNQVYFPDKVHMKKYSLENDLIQENILPPKLDFNRIKGRYQPLSNIVVADKTNNGKPYKKSNSYILPNYPKPKNKKSSFVKEKEINLKLDDLKKEIENSKKSINDITFMIEQYKKQYKESKIKLMKIKENIKLANSKIESFENQIKILLEEEQFSESFTGEDDNDNWSEEGSNDESF